MVSLFAVASVAATPGAVSPVTDAVDWLGGGDVMPAHISPAKTGVENTIAKTIAAKGNLNRFIVFPLVGLCLVQSLIVEE